MNRSNDSGNHDPAARTPSTHDGAPLGDGGQPLNVTRFSAQTQASSGISSAQSGNDFMDEFDSHDRLHPQYAAALDALMHADCRVEGVDPEMRPIARGMVRLLSLLDRMPPVDQESGLVDVTLARVAQLRRNEVRSESSSLSDMDQDALEALISAGYDVSRVPSTLRDRSQRVAGLLGLLGASVPAPEVNAAPLTDRTLARVQRAIEEHEQTMVLESTRGQGGWSFRLPDAIAVAALLLVGVSLLGPMAMGVREYNRRTACASNMNVAGIGFGQYANDNRSNLPVASAAKPGNAWWHVGKGPEQSNSANLYMLNRASYTKVEQLACCGNPSAPKDAPHDAVDWRSLDEVSYSYQCQFTVKRPLWSQGSRVVVLADASPVVRRAARGEIVIFPFENSANHDRRGQNLLYNDGSAEWLTSPVLSGGRHDNIWLPLQVENIIARLNRPSHADPIIGNESPQFEDDSFVGP